MKSSDHHDALVADNVWLESCRAVASGDLASLGWLESTTDRVPEVARDYICDHVAAAVADKDADADVGPWALVAFGLTRNDIRDHPRFPPLAELLQAAAVQRAPPGATVVAAARALDLGAEDIRAATAVLVSALTAGASLRREVADLAVAILALWWPGTDANVGADVVAVVRGIEAWDARARAARWRPSSGNWRLSGIHEDLVARLIDRGPWVWDRATSSPIPFRYRPYGPPDEFAAAVGPTAWAHHARRFPHGAEARAELGRQKVIDDLRAWLWRGGVRLDDKTGRRIEVDRDADFNGPDGRLAIACALADLETLRHAGFTRETRAIVENLVADLALEQVPALYWRWLENLRQRG